MMKKYSRREGSGKEEKAGEKRKKRRKGELR